MDNLEPEVKLPDAQTREFFDSLKRESDRGCALVAGQMLDNALEELLRKAMSADDWARKDCVEGLFAGMAPLGTFSAKILACGALGLIDEELATDVDTIRKIRNNFGHSTHVATFDDPSTSALVRNLKLIAGSFPPDMKDKNWRHPTLGFSFSRVRFMFGTSWCLGILHGLAESRQQQK
jgi:DNA-binding MltR family transcriptional regulator